MSVKEILWESYSYDFHDKDIDDEEFEDYKDSEGPGPAHDIPVVMNTSFGAFSVDDSLNPFRRHEFWIGYTNFDITHSVSEKIEEVPGVEILKVETRYRFIIGVGKMFSFSNVRIKIEKILCNKHINQSLLDAIECKDVRENAYEVYNDFKKRKSFWCIYIFPNGYTISQDFKTEEDYVNDIPIYETLLTLTDGLLITPKGHDGST